MIDPDFLRAIATEHNVSDLELETLSLAMEGKSIEAIAQTLKIREDTVRKRLSDVYRKFDVPGTGPVKRAKLQQMLVTRYQEYQAQKSTLSANSAFIEQESILSHQSWGEAPDTSIFYGREEELTRLEEWITKDHCRLVAILGMGGMGKTALSVKLAQKIQKQFEFVIWRSLRNRSDVKKLVDDWIHFLSKSEEPKLPEDLNEKITLLIELLRSHRCLLVIDNFETILKSGDFVGHYLDEYKGYGMLLRRIGETDHKSCLVITSREKPREIALLEGDTLPVRSLVLEGLGKAAREIFQSKGLSGEEKWEILLKFYRGNPLALKIIATTIQDLFDGNVAQFVEQSLSAVILDVSVLIEQQLMRLTELEEEIIFWLALEKSPVSLAQLKENIIRPVSLSDLVNALNSLSGRSLIEKQAASFTLQSAVREYILNRFVEQVSYEIQSFSNIQELRLFRSYLLSKPGELDERKKAETNSVLSLVKDKIYSRSNFNQTTLEQQLQKILTMIEGKSFLEVGYIQTNVENLLKEIQQK